MILLVSRKDLVCILNKITELYFYIYKNYMKYIFTLFLFTIFISTNILSSDEISEDCSSKNVPS